MMNTMHKGHTIVPGLRIWKTALAVFLCLVVDSLRGAETTHSLVAAVICMKAGLSDSWKAGFDRFIGTAIAGVYSYLFLLVFQVWLQIDSQSLLYYGITALFIVPLIAVILHGRGPGAVSIGAIVFLIICISGSDISPLNYAVSRVIDTSVGIIMAVFVNWIPFLRGNIERSGT